MLNLQDPEMRTFFQPNLTKKALNMATAQTTRGRAQSAYTWAGDLPPSNQPTN